MTCITPKGASVRTADIRVDGHPYGPGTLVTRTRQNGDDMIGTSVMLAAALLAPIPANPATDTAGTTKPVSQQAACEDVLAKRLYATGFRGDNLREAWAIAMRESGGRPDAISSTGDYGAFQLNRAAHGKQAWWDTNRLLTWQYNLQVVYEITDGGRTWYPWDIDGKGRHLARYTSTGTYRKYLDWYAKFPCERQ